jgi:antitoxin component of RelBE/YafQ-DinJ toxin-antitoxin module
MNNNRHKPGQKMAQVRARIFESQMEQLKGIEARTGIEPSAVIRLALDVLLPKIQNENVIDIDKALEQIFK